MKLAEALKTIEELRERIRQLEEEATPSVQLPRSWSITNSEAHILRCILVANGGIVSIASIQTKVYGMRSSGVTDAVIYAHIRSIRKKLPWLQIAVAHGRGYYINSQDVYAFYARIRAENDAQTFRNND